MCICHLTLSDQVKSIAFVETEKVSEMSATTKKKHVTKEVLEEYPLPNENRQVVKVTAARGNNLHEVVSPLGDTFLVSMPPKFRKHVWIKRGDFILIEPIEEGDKVRGEISHILFKDQIKHIQENKKWPEAFVTNTDLAKESMIPDDLLPPSGSDEDTDNENLADLVVNMNRVHVSRLESESEDSCSEDEEESEGEICVGKDQLEKDIGSPADKTNNDAHWADASCSVSCVENSCVK
ncbi:eukaryotic translation initiation factor 1a domain containing [Plakobranchus ocellatus]|uniref:Probable RNA-binding protein EIF1AD n=1 Tax=Plakobranchus ocellatus TaxID=259542 RepID=A0AAV4CS92_9GAST|nr:eukaryotic translation initiation factor 1a domain containing [Plakobranchus ocellatus]